MPCPPPPENFTLTPKPAFSKGTRTFYRFNPAGYSSCLYFPRDKTFRFDDPDQSFGVLYASVQPDGAFAETYGHDVTQLPNDDYKIISEHELTLRHVFELHITGLRLARFCGNGLATLNLDGNICTMPDYTVPQQWAKWVHQHTKGYDGIIFHSRYLPTIESIALFERAKKKVVNEMDLGIALDFVHPRTGKTMEDILINQGWGLVDA
ncbi:MAG: RES family NAD+ phosphorylase [Gammaproteobacteria bacterium]